MCLRMQPTEEKRSSVHLFIHSVIHSFWCRSLVSQSVQRIRQSFSQCSASMLHSPHSTLHTPYLSYPRPRLRLRSTSRSIFRQAVNIFNRRCLGCLPRSSFFVLDPFSFNPHRSIAHIVRWTKQVPS